MAAIGSGAPCRSSRSSTRSLTNTGDRTAKLPDEAIVPLLGVVDSACGATFERDSEPTLVHSRAALLDPGIDTSARPIRLIPCSSAPTDSSRRRVSALASTRFVRRDLRLLDFEMMPADGRASFDTRWRSLGASRGGAVESKR